ncbi:AAA family ATPase [Alphaproteobacteria bacterium]|nr:AAA family ATPase [Alphaproteobacteria bacterium]
MACKVVSISNHKGGVGKTTSAVNIGAGLVERGKKVLLVDLDPQANLTQSLSTQLNTSNIYEVLRGEEAAQPTKYKNNLYIIPSTLDLSGAEMELISEPGRERILSDALDGLKDSFDYIIIDCPPSLGLLTINAFTASDVILVPLQAEYLAMRGLSKLNSVIDKIRKRLNKRLKIGGVFLTQYDARKILNRNIAESVSEVFSGKLLETKISNNVSLAEAPATGQDIFLYNKNSKGAKDYRELCNELSSRGVL